VNPGRPGDPAARLVYRNTDFTAKNYGLRFYIETIDGNNAKTFRVSPVTQSAAVAANTMVAGNVYTIASVGNTDWALAGAPVKWTTMWHGQPVPV